MIHAPRRAGRAALRALAAWLVMACVAWPPAAAEAYREEAVKAAFLNRFTAYVEWPPGAFDDGTFHITVLGAPEVAEELKRLLSGRQVKGLPVAISSALPRSAARPHLLYVGRSFTGNVGRLVRDQGRRPMLVVTDQPQGLAQGGAINFLLVDQRLRFEVSLEPVHESGLAISSQLLAVAVRVLGARAEGAR